MSGRALRFRVWDGDIAYFASVQDLCHGYPAADVGSPVRDLVFEQWTGLTDRNGRDVYEGDLLDTGGLIAVVRFGSFEDADSYENIGWYLQSTKDGHTWGLDSNSGTVCGNAHEHVHLLAPATPASPSQDT